MHVLGLMSGTSADGVDAVCVQFKGVPERPSWKLLNVVSTPYPLSLRQQVVDVSQGLQLSSKEWLELSEAITEVHAEAALSCASLGEFDLVGCHGQTVWHRPPNHNFRGASCQLLNASLLAELLQRPVVHDFRSLDLALGGQGAPLVPKPDDALIGRVDGWRAILNLGGISNLTLIPPRSGPHRFSSVLGWDCGPANSLLDLAIQKITNGEHLFDNNGLIAANGCPDESMIERWLQEPFFVMPPPKSTGREQFGVQDMERRFSEMPISNRKNFASTLTAFSAALVASDLDKIYARSFIRPIEMIVAGGGSRNLSMLKEIISRCKGIRVRTIEDFGIPSEGREPLAFALLAWWHILDFPGNLPSVTGAKKEIVLGICANPPY